MSKMIQIRHVPDSLHRQLRVRASRAGMSLSDFVKAELEHSVRYLTMDEALEKLEALEPVEATESSADIIRRHRGK